MDYQQQLALFPCLPSPASRVVNSTNKRVRMNPTVLVHDIIGLKSLTKQKKSKLFYTKDDYNMTVLEIKAIVLTNQPPETPNTTSCTGEEDNNSSNSSMLADEADDFLRGIELQMYPQRFQNKLVARKALLKYQTYLHEKRTKMTPEQKAEAMRKASEKLSTWSHLVAQETARLDSIRAYDRDYLIPLNGVPVQFSTYPDLTFQRKGSEDQQVPRVTSEDRPYPFKKARAAEDEALPLPLP
mmetsp:Transcript_24274/g.41431  ORF Transcript_24274/g.41431 Transcript_24274/m.41431 type:complete len:241 (-) Transcript_24274:55-777(-)